MVDNYVPNTGDIVWLDFKPSEGEDGRRPALVLSPKAYNGATQLMLACPITATVKDYPFEVRVALGKIDGVVLADQINNLDWSVRNIWFEGKAPGRVLEQTQELIAMLVADS